jgi:hypothetical protein
MNTRDIVLVGAGVAVGYLLVGYLKKSKDNSGSTDEIVTTDAILPAPDQATIDACNKEADDFMATIRPSAGADLGQIRKEKFDSCIASKQV